MKSVQRGIAALLAMACPAAAASSEPQSLDEARTALTDGREWDALRAFGEVLLADPDNAEARAGAATILDRNRGSHGAAALAGTTDARAADMAAARVRWGAEVRPEEVARRFEGTDRAIADLDALLAKLTAEPAPDEGLVRRVRLDRMVALRDRVRMAEVIAEAEALAPLPAYADQAYADALLYARRPEAALAAYDRVLAADPGNIEALYGRVFALVEQESLTEAFAAADAIANEQPRFRAPAGGPATNPNPEHAYAAQLAAEVRLWGNRPADGTARLTPLANGAPANAGFRRAMAGAYSARGWPRRAEAEAQVAASLDPDSLATGLVLADSALVRRRLGEAEERIEGLVALAPENRGVQRLEQELRAARGWQLSAELRPTWNDGGGGFASGEGYDFGATLVSPEVAPYLRLLARIDLAEAAPPEGRVTRNRVGGGVQVRTPDVEASLYSTRSWGTVPETAVGAAVAVELDDRWTWAAQGEINSIELPMRALLADISGDSASTSLTWRRDERLRLSAGVSWLGYSDGNDRVALSGNAVQQLMARPHFDLTGRVDLYASWNSRAGGPYFAPTSDFSASAGLLAQHVAWRRYQKSFVQALSADTGLYAQEGFGRNWIGVVRYEHRWRHDPWTEIVYGVSVDRRVYDGVAENGVALMVGVRQAL
jgi:biofilm PGA synthesis protein PgaA